NDRQKRDGALGAGGARGDGESERGADRGGEYQNKADAPEFGFEVGGEIDDAEHDRALEHGKQNKENEFREDIGGKFQVDHALAVEDGPFADDVARGVVAAEPDGGNHHEDVNADDVRGHFLKLREGGGGAGDFAVDQNDKRGYERGLQAEDGHLRA